MFLQRTSCLGLVITALLGGLLTAAPASAAETPNVETFLIEGDLAGGRAALQQHLKNHPDDAEARYGLGLVELLGSFERLSQLLYRHGALATTTNVPFLRVVTIENPDPHPIDYTVFRTIIQQFADDLAKARETLAAVDDDEVKLPLRVGLIRLDLDGDGKATDAETFWRLFSKVALRGANVPPQQREFVVGFDAADVHWMRGYCHLLSALAEAYLAYDSEQFFDHTAHLVFAGAESPYPYLGRPQQPNGFNPDQFADLIAAIHLFRWEVKEPKRMQRAREHLLAMVEQSRECWKDARRETDNDREWIPNPQQTSLLPGMTVNGERVAEWGRFLDEWEAILEGKKLVPHWRVRDGRGINLKRVFEEPRTFDLVMWVHGAGIAPFLEEGEQTQPETWQRLQRTFGGNFLGFALWFN